MAHHTFGKEKVVLSDWFEDQDEEVKNLLKDKNPNRSALRERIRAMKNKWFQKKAEKAKQYSQEMNHHEFYASLSEAFAQKITKELKVGFYLQNQKKSKIDG